MKKFLTMSLFAALALTLAGCDDDKPVKFVTFHIANITFISTSNTRSQMTMPVSGVTLFVNNIEFMYSGDLKQIDVAKVNLPQGGSVDGFYFTCDDRGTRRLYTATASNLNAFVVVMYGKEPIAVRRIDSAIGDGKIFAPTELPPGKDLVKLKDEMNESIKAAEEVRNGN